MSAGRGGVEGSIDHKARVERGVEREECKATGGCMDGMDKMVFVGVDYNCQSLFLLDYECGMHVGMPTAVCKQIDCVHTDGSDNECSPSQLNDRTI